MERIWVFLSIMLDVYPFFFLQYRPFRNHLRFPFSITILLGSAPLMFQFVGYVVLWEQNSHVPEYLMLCRVALLPVLCLLTIVLVDDIPAKSLFMVMLLVPYTLFVSGVAYYISGFIHIPNAPPFMVTDILRILISGGTYIIIDYWISHQLMPLMNISDRKVWRSACGIPTTLAIAGLVFVNSGAEFTGFTLKELLLRTATFFCCVFTCFFLLKLLKQVRESTRLEQSVDYSQKLLHMQKEQYHLLANSIEEARMARHDLRHHLTLIRSYLDNREYQRLGDFLNSYTTSLSIDTELRVCENHAANTIIQYYLALAERENIAVDVNLDLKEQTSMQDTDLCVILCNGLENAVTACKTVSEQQRFIKMVSRQVGAFLSLTIDNSFDGEVHQHNNRYYSRRNGFSSEGTGLASMQLVVERYHGVMEVKHDQQVFLLSILLPLEG